MNLPILVAGGGIGGLTLAALLRRRGRNVLVLERASHFAPVGAGLVLQPNAIKALRRCGLETAVVGRGVAMQRMEIRDLGGRVLSSFTASTFVERFGAGAVGFHRATLHAALLERVEASSLRLSAGVRSCTEIAAGVAVELETGERVEGAALVGADGLRSAVREHLIHDGEPRYSGYTSWRGVTSRRSLWPAGVMSESWGHGARFGLVAIDGDRLYWFATANALPGGRYDGKAELLDRFSTWHEPIPATIESTPDDAILRTGISDREPLPRWGAGRMTLLGDAAHPMTPDLGQGGGQAIEDAVVLDACLSANEDYVAAFRDYESRRLARTGRVVREARRFGRMGQIENAGLCSLRNVVVRTMPASFTLRSLRWLYDFDV